MSATKPRKRPVQDRAKRTVEAMVEATAHILSTDGPDALSTNRIAEVAGVSIGSLYQYFPSKESVVASLVEHLLEADRALLQEALDDIDAPDLGRALADALVVACQRQRDTAPALRHLLPRLAELDRHELVDAEVDRLIASFEVFLQRWRGHLRQELRDDPKALHEAVFVLAHGLRGSLNAATQRCPERLTEPSFCDLLLRQAVALLLP